MVFDVAIIGGGILGCATAYRLACGERVDSIAIIEKESQLAAHQTGRNSGVIHSGIYYTPGSQKAENCRVGRRQLIEFCEKEDLPYEICGKVIVAVSDHELGGIRRILERGSQNGIACEPIGPDEIKELEPSVRGLAGIHVPDAGIVDFGGVCRRLAERSAEKGGQILSGRKVTGLDTRADRVVVETSGGAIEARCVVNCAGLYSDTVARLAGDDPDVRIVPFRGVYYELTPPARSLCKNLIYPVPDPAYPFLGVHFTRMIDGRVECGPNAVMALGREGYSWRQPHFGEFFSSLAFSGFRSLARRHWRKGVSEVARTVSKKRYLRALQTLIPSISMDDIVPCRSGIRAQAIDRSGNLVDDFLVVESERMIHVCNAPSPAATAGLRIGQMIAKRVSSRFS